MPINVIIFGRLADIAGSSVSLENIGDTDGLIKKLVVLYPALADAKYAIAVDKKLVHGNTRLADDNVVALLPPFSGG